MHQYGEDGLCLLWGVNNALQKKILTKEPVFREIQKINANNTNRNIRHYVGKDGLDFKAFKAGIKNLYGISLRRVKEYKMKGAYLLTYDFGSYYHTVALVDGEVLDSRKEKEITTLNTVRRLVDVYKVVK
jgi:hypothetical protein